MKNPLILFLIGVVVLAAIFFTLPINLFDGVIVIEEPYRSFQLERPLSLSYFIGLGYEETDMEYVKDFYLTSKGIAIAVIIIIGFPALFAYRIYLKQKTAE